MTITEAEELQVAKILGVTYRDVHEKLTYLNTLNGVTAALETSIRTELARWVTSGEKFTKLHPKESNKGVETDPLAVKGDIKKNLANLLYFTALATSGGNWGYSTRS